METLAQNAVHFVVAFAAFVLVTSGGLCIRKAIRHHHQKWLHNRFNF